MKHENYNNNVKDNKFHKLNCTRGRGLRIVNICYYNIKLIECLNQLQVNHLSYYNETYKEDRTDRCV